MSALRTKRASYSGDSLHQEARVHLPSGHGETERFAEEQPLAPTRLIHDKATAGERGRLRFHS
jgi:hypothetical protein